MHITAKPESIPERALIKPLADDNGVSYTANGEQASSYTIEAICGEAITAGNAVSIIGDTVYLAKPDSSLGHYAIGIAVFSGGKDAITTVQLTGIYSDSSYDFDGEIVRLGSGAVNLTTDEIENARYDNVYQIMGTAINSNTIMLNIEKPTLLSM